MTSAIGWTSSLRADLAPREPTQKKLDVEKTWAKLRARFSTLHAPFKRGLTGENVAREAMEAALSVIESKTFPHDASPAALGAMLVLANNVGLANEVTMLIAQSRDASVMVESLVVAHGMSFAYKYPASWITAEASATPIGWRALRDVALRHGDADVRKVAKRVWKDAPLSLKIVLSHALISAHDLAAETAKEIAALPETSRTIVSPLLATLHDATHIEAVLAHRMGAHPLVDAVENLGEAALPAFLAAWTKPIGDRLQLARATSAYLDARAAKILAGEIDKKTTSETARAYFIHHPDLAEDVLSAKAKTKFGLLAAELLASAKRTLVSHEEVPLAELPMVLSRPPWLSEEKNRKFFVVHVKAIDRAETIVTGPKRRAAIATQVAFTQFPEMTSDALTDFIAKVKSDEIGMAWWLDRVRVPKETLLELITTVGYNAHTPQYFPFAAATFFGDVAVTPLVDWAIARWGTLVSSLEGYAMRDAVLELDSHRFAAAYVSAIEDGKGRALAWKYFARHVETSLIGVIPVALGRASNRRRAAESVIRKLAVHHAREVRDVAATYGEAASKAVEEILAFDGRWDCPRSPPKMPQEWRPKTFTRPLAKDGRALPLQAVEHIGHMLAFSDDDAPYIGLDDVRAICEPRSLAEMSWDAARAWERANCRSVSRWMIESIAYFGDDEVIRRTTPAIKCQEIVGVLGRAATDAAAIELCTLAWRIKQQKSHSWRSRHWGTRTTVIGAFEELARRRNSTIDQVMDALTPTIALTEPRVKLDYGSRIVDVGFDERLDPFIETVRGKLRKIPNAGKKDDPAKVARAQQIWDELLEDVTAIADLRLDSLERAMISGRAWTLDAFRKAWMDHPLMRHLSRGVVWRAGTKTFRIAEDGSFADETDSALDGSGEMISVAHPAEMRDDEREAWRRVFFDYRIAQPLEQLTRRLLAHTEAATLTLVPDAPLTQAESGEKIRSFGFETSWRGREQIATRACVRTPLIRLRITAAIEDRKVVHYTLAAEQDAVDVGLSLVSAVDLGEIVHIFSLRPA